MAVTSDARLLVLHGLRLKGFALADVVAETTDLAEEDVRPILDALQAEGLVLYREGRLTGFALTPDGRREHEHLLTAELEASGHREDVTSAYKRFLELNQELLATCTRWQLREVDGASVVNDHTDAAHDAAVVRDLAALHECVEPVVTELAEQFERYSRYGPRLAEALERVQAGEGDYFTKPIIPSYHTVWFELHEDLLATLGIERAAEEAT
jgi:hypothetical protein